MTIGVLLFFLPLGEACAEEVRCPRYPLSAMAPAEPVGFVSQGREAITIAHPRRNFIDTHLFRRMEQENVAPAELTSDYEFLRRASLDLTGRIPAPDAIDRFVRDSTGDKRARMVESLLASTAYTDHWTLYHGNLFEVTSAYYTYIGITGRNNFHRFLRDFISRDRSYRDVVTEMLTASGDSDADPASGFLIRAWNEGAPIQDTWDTLTDRVSTKLLGYKTECISCHNGRRHLEAINAHLTTRNREDFFRLSAFFSRTIFQQIPSDVYNQRVRFFIIDRSTGMYDGAVDPNIPGSRPPRIGGPWSPAYFTTGEEPRTANWRQEFARMLTTDRQFARATVNYLWAALFRYGIVDPPGGWDLARVDPAKPPSEPWALQNTNPELLEELTDTFIRANYSVKTVLRLMANSSAYQLSSRYPGIWRPQYTSYFARYNPRRLSAEQLYDAQVTATQSERALNIQGFDQPVYYAAQLPDPTEPRSDYGVRESLNLYGRGDWWTQMRTAEPSILQLLWNMNSVQTILMTHPSDYNTTTTRVLRVDASAVSDEDAIRQIFLCTLSRLPGADELKIALDSRQGRTRRDWLSDLQWALMNKVDFVFNY